MKRLSLMAVLAVAALTVALGAMSASASAAATLPEFTVETPFTAKFGESKLNTSGAEIKSTTGQGINGKPTSKKLGTVTIWFESSSLGGKECHSEGDTEGNILVPAEWHLVHPVKGTTYDILFLINTAVKIKCKFLATTVEVLSGSTILGKLTPGKTKTKTFTLEVNAPGGKQELTTYENDAEESVTTALKLKVDGVSATGSQEDQAATITAEKETELIN